MPSHDYRTCSEKDCDECQELIDLGIIMCCDFCDCVGVSESNGWVMVDPDTLMVSTNGQISCISCATSFGNVIYEDD